MLGSCTLINIFSDSINNFSYIMFTKDTYKTQEYRKVESKIILNIRQALIKESH